MRYQLYRLQQFAKFESRGVWRIKTGQSWGPPAREPLDDNHNNISISPTFHPATPFQCNKYMGSFIFHKTPTHSHARLIPICTTLPSPPPFSPRHVPIPVLIAHVSPSAPRRTAEGSHTKTSKQDTRAPPQANPRARASRLLFWAAMSTNGQKGDPGRETARNKKRYERFDAAAAASHNQPIRVRLGWLHLPLVIPARRRTQVRHIISPCLGASTPDFTLPSPSNQRRPSRSPDLQTPILASGEGSPISDLESIPPPPPRTRDTPPPHQGKRIAAAAASEVSPRPAPADWLPTATMPC